VLNTYPRFSFDQSAALATHCDWVIGVDEVGRGSWVGPVITAAVCFFPQTLADPDALNRLAFLNDSKKLRADQREALAGILPVMGWTAIAEASQQEVETLNLHYASILGLRRAVEGVLKLKLPGKNGLILVDGKFPLPNLDGLAQQYKFTLTQMPVIQGDSLSASIAAASVIAKTHRDALLTALSIEHPGYGWERNAGYGTPHHQQALRRLGVTPLHRKTFKFMQNLPVEATLFAGGV